MTKIAHGLGDLSPGWFTSVLRDSGSLPAGAVTEIELEPIGGGLMSRSVRASLTYDVDTDAPSSLIVKFPTEDPGSLALATAMHMYELELRFYREIVPRTAMSAAGCYLAAFDETSNKFTLVLEDLSRHSRPGDVLTPASVDEVSHALAELVGLQAPLWDSPWLLELGWLATPTATAALFDGLSAGIEPFLERFGHGLDSEHVELFEAVMPHAGDWVRGWQSPIVVQHGDFRPDNLMFGTDPGAPAVTVIDFHTVRLGPPGIDAAYLLGGSLTTEDRRSTELELISGYHDRLSASGVHSFDFDDCWRSYREGALYGVILFVGTASQVESTERGDRVIVDQIRRYADMAIDLEAATAAALA
jgi:hypothetical protein